MSITLSIVSPTFKGGYVGETDSSSPPRPSTPPPTSRLESVATEIDRFSVQAIQGEQVSDWAAPLVGILNPDIESSMEESQLAPSTFSIETSQIQQRVIMQLKDYKDDLAPNRYHTCSNGSSFRYYKSHFDVHSPGLNPLGLSIQPCRQAKENPASNELLYQLYANKNNHLLATFVVELLGTENQKIQEGLKHHQRDHLACKLRSGKPDEIGIVFAYEILFKGRPSQIKISIEDLEEKPFITSLFFISGMPSRPSKDMLEQLSSAQSSERGPMRHTPTMAHTQTGPYTRPMEPSHSPRVSTPPTVDYNSTCTLSGKTKTFTDETVVLVPCGHTFDSNAFYKNSLTFLDLQLSQQLRCPEPKLHCSEPGCNEGIREVIRLKSRSK